jgi:hypothetical protein
VADAIDTARDALIKQIRELEEQVGRLKGALSELNRNGASSTKPRRRARSGGTRRRAGGKRAPRGAREAQFLAVVEAKPGATGTEIAKEIGISPNQVYGLAHRLTDAGKIRKRRGGGYALKG